MRVFPDEESIKEQTALLFVTAYKRHEEMHSVFENRTRELRITRIRLLVLRLKVRR